MRSVLTAACVLLLLAGSSFASIVESAAPTTGILVSQTGHGSLDPVDGIGLDLRSAFRSAGQTFTAPSTTTIDAIYLGYSVEAGRTNPVPLTIKVWELTGSFAPAAPTTVLYTETATVAYTNYAVDPSLHILKFDIADLPVVAGHFYAFEVTTTAARFGDAGFVVNTDSDSYMDGQPVRRIGTTSSALYTTNTTGDLLFYVTAVPEPATMSLLALGGLAAMIRRRK